jgi:hypothetical protein
MMAALRQIQGLFDLSCALKMADHKTSKVQVNSKEDLVDFIEAMKEDLLRNPAQWENATLDRFLGAMAAWVRVMDDLYRNTRRPPVCSENPVRVDDVMKLPKLAE